MFVAIAESVGIPMFTLLVILVTLVVFAIDKWAGRCGRDGVGYCTWHLWMCGIRQGPFRLVK